MNSNIHLRSLFGNNKGATTKMRLVDGQTGPYVEWNIHDGEGGNVALYLSPEQFRRLHSIMARFLYDTPTPSTENGCRNSLTAELTEEK